MYTVIMIFAYGSEAFSTFETAEQAEDKAAELRAAGYMVRIEEA